eukprot:7205248-Pyramimonas_sp.AAC.1
MPGSDAVGSVQRGRGCSAELQPGNPMVVACSAMSHLIKISATMKPSGVPARPDLSASSPQLLPSRRRS